MSEGFKCYGQKRATKSYNVCWICKENPNTGGKGT